MNITRASTLSASLGAIVPVVFRAVWWIVDSNSLVGTSGKIVLEKITLILWPSSFFMLAADSNAALGLRLFLFSLLANAILYGGIGVALFYGLTRYKALLLAPIVVMSTIWFWLLSTR
jgi:hypothetical protein